MLTECIRPNSSTIELSISMWICWPCTRGSRRISWFRVQVSLLHILVYSFTLAQCTSLLTVSFLHNGHACTLWARQYFVLAEFTDFSAFCTNLPLCTSLCPWFYYLSILYSCILYYSLFHYYIASLPLCSVFNNRRLTLQCFLYQTRRILN